MKTNLLKRVVSGVIAGIMVAVTLPILSVNAEITDWTTLAEVSLNNFTDTDPYASNYDNFSSWTDSATGWTYYASGHGERVPGTYDGKAIRDDRTGVFTIANENDSDWWRQGIKDISDLPAGMGTKAYKVNRQYVDAAPVGSANYASVRLSNMFDTSDVEVGQTVKITAWVWNAAVYNTDGNYGAGTTTIEARETTKVDTRMFLSQLNNQYTGTTTQYSLDTPVEGEIVSTKLEAYAWVPITLEYEVSVLNMGINSVRIDNISTETHPYELYVAGYKVEVGGGAASGGAEDNAPYIENGYEWRSLTGKVNLNQFADTVYASNWDNYSSWTDTEKNWTYYVSAHGESDVVTNPSSYTATSIRDDKTGIYSLGTLNDGGVWHSNIADVATLPTGMGSQVYRVNRQWAVNPEPRNYASIRISNMFDAASVSVGQKIKVTAWVYAGGVYDAKASFEVTGSQYPAATAPNVNTRMFLSQRNNLTYMGTSEAYAPNVAYEGEMEEVTMKPYAWTPVTLEYLVTPENEGINSVRIDNQSQTVFPYELCLAGFQVEVGTEVPPPTTAEGWEQGEDTYAFVTVDTDAFTNASEFTTPTLIVAAYDGNTFLGCDIAEYNPAVADYTLTIEGVTAATKVVGFMWDMATLEPCFADFDIPIYE